MSIRFALHIVALFLLALLGMWLTYRSIYEHTLDGLFTVMYWFGFLVYVLFVSTFYMLLRNRSGRALFLAHFFSALIGAIATVVTMQLGERYEAQKSNLATSDQQDQDLKTSAN